MFISFRREIPENDYITFRKRLADLEQRVSSLEMENNILRDKVLRKIQKSTSTFESRFNYAIPTHQKV